MGLIYYLEIIWAWYADIRQYNRKAFNQQVRQLENILDLSYCASPIPEINLCLADSPEVRGEYRDHFITMDLFDYIYAILHLPEFRMRNITTSDLMWLPQPSDKQFFWNMAALGGNLRRLHQTDARDPDDTIANFPITGNNIISHEMSVNGWELISHKGLLQDDLNKHEQSIGRIWINQDQYFENVPLEEWKFYIIGDRPALKYLQDRRGLLLDINDISLYQTFISTISRTNQLLRP